VTEEEGGGQPLLAGHVRSNDSRLSRKSLEEGLEEKIGWDDPRIPCAPLDGPGGYLLGRNCDKWIEVKGVKEFAVAY